MRVPKFLTVLPPWCTIWTTGLLCKVRWKKDKTKNTSIKPLGHTHQQNYTVLKVRMFAGKVRGEAREQGEQRKKRQQWQGEKHRATACLFSLKKETKGSQSLSLLSLSLSLFNFLYFSMSLSLAQLSIHSQIRANVAIKTFSIPSLGPWFVQHHVGLAKMLPKATTVPI